MVEKGIAVRVETGGAGIGGVEASIMVNNLVVAVNPSMVVTAIHKHLFARVRIGNRINVTYVFGPFVTHAIQSG